MFTLNRTIVGWKLVIERYLGPGGDVFKSHHSGMETLTRTSSRVMSHSFKSHHSGMETEKIEFCHNCGGALNRTIVGWKRRKPRR